MVMIEVTDELADRLAKLKRRVKQAGFTAFVCCCNEYNERALAFYFRQGGVEIARESGHVDRSEVQISLLFHLE